MTGCDEMNLKVATGGAAMKKMTNPQKLRVKLLNGISEEMLRKSAYIIYAHECPAGVYVGQATDVVERYRQHVGDANNENSLEYGSPFKKAIRLYQSNIKHYVLAVDQFPKAALDKEAAAIQFYGRNLNTKAEPRSKNCDYGFKPIDGQIGKLVMLEIKKRKRTGGRADSGRFTVTAEICMNRGRKRLRTVGNQENVPVGIYIECNRAARDEHEVGDRVKLNVGWSNQNGKPYLTASPSASFRKA